MKCSGLLWAALVIVAGLSSPGVSFASEAEELQALKAEIAAERAALAEERKALQEQRQRVDDALRRLDEERPSTIAVATPSVGALPAVSAPESEGPRLDIYGFAMMDAIYDFDQSDPDWKGALRTSKIPVNCPTDPGCGDEDGETTLSVRQSRLGAKGFFPTPLGEMRTIFEFELYGVGDDAGETTFRLRHAWGELGQFGAGQTWSLFMNPDVFPNTIEYWGPPGMAFYRNVQARWTPIDDETTKFAVAIEHPGSAVDAGKIGQQIDPAFAAGIKSWNQFPDVTLQYRHLGDWGHFQASGIMRAVGVQGPTDFEEQEFGWGINLSTAVNLFEKDQLLVQVLYGEGIANYMNDGGTDLAPDSPVPPAHADAVSTIGWLAYYNRTWNDRFTSSFGYSEHRQDTTSGQLGNAMEVIQYATVNVLYQPIPDFFVGPEFIWGRRENRDGEDASDTRLQFSAKYKFNGTIGR